MRATSVNDEEMAAPAKPSIRTVAAPIVTVGIVMGLWVSLTLVLDLIFHFHPTVLRAVCGLDAAKSGWFPATCLAGTMGRLGRGARLTLLRSRRR